MNKKNGTKAIPFIIAVFIALNGIFAQDVTTVSAVDGTIGDNLNLEAVASLFGESKDLEDFEKRLNDPKTQISNLDLNEDSQVDYLRVVETSEKNTHVIAIQAVVGKDMYQDVATIEVEKDNKGTVSVQVVGDVYMYGPNYIIEPVYVYRPVFFSLFWRPYYRPYRSVYYWGFYPRHFHYWHPFHVNIYRKNVHVHINTHYTYKHTSVRRSTTAVAIHRKTRRNDYGKKYPHKSYKIRTAGVTKANGTQKRAVQVKSANGNTYSAAGVNKPNGTKKRVAGIHQADGDNYKMAGINKPDGTKKRVVAVNKADGTKKRGYAVQKPNGNRKAITSKKKPAGMRTATKAKKGHVKRKKGANNTKRNVAKRKKKRK